MTSKSGRSDLGFLGPSRVCCENPRFWGLEFLGFPWILSSESRLFNGLCGINREEFFLPLFGVAKERSERQPTIWRAKGTDCSRGKLKLISAFLQEIVVAGISPRGNLRIALFYLLRDSNITGRAQHKRRFNLLTLTICEGARRHVDRT